jgi:CubicO group peptidase (beta-lactamase class C family)
MDAAGRFALPALAVPSGCSTPPPLLTPTPTPPIPPSSFWRSDDSAAEPLRGSQQPGSCFIYNDRDFSAAGAINVQRTGRDIYDAFDEDIARPLGRTHARAGRLGADHHDAGHAARAASATE